MSYFGVLLVGFLLGIKHAMEADHLAAVATLATRHSSIARSMRHGLAWGIGHTLTLLLFGGVVLVLGRSIPEPVALGLEFAVGLMLIWLGVEVLRRLARQRIHLHAHTHGSQLRHVHAHSHAGEPSRAHSAHAHSHPGSAQLKALAIGAVHGMAGSAALIVLSLGSVQSWAIGLAYIVLFGAGSILGMAVLSVAVALPLRLTLHHAAWAYTGLTIAIGVLSCLLGLQTMYRMGVAAAFGWS